MHPWSCVTQCPLLELQGCPRPQQPLGQMAWALNTNNMCNMCGPCSSPGCCCSTDAPAKSLILQLAPLPLLLSSMLLLLLLLMSC